MFSRLVNILKNRGGPSMELSVLGIDLAKNVFQLHGVDSDGKEILRKKVSRSQLLTLIGQLPPCLIGMEACGGAHHWARQFQKLGHEVKLVSPQFVKPYVKSNKNDAADAEAICEAVTRPSMRFVPIKSTDQQEIQSLHRVRERLIKGRTALSNEIRGLLHEFGIVIPRSIAAVKKKLAEVVSDPPAELCSALMIPLIQELQQELQLIEERIERITEKIRAIHQAHPVCQRLETIPGVGPLIATALIAAVGDPRAFKNGREMSAWLGLVPRQNSSGGKEKLLGISKRGDVYLRKLVIHGARAALLRIDRYQDRRGIWARSLLERRGKNRATVALANKNTRIAWALMVSEKEYQTKVV
jgi:transposase